MPFVNKEQSLLDWLKPCCSKAVVNLVNHCLETRECDLCGQEDLLGAVGELDGDGFYVSGKVSELWSG